VRDLVLAGGVFANVKFNQKISELDCVDSLYVYPDMGDGGLAYGAAMLSDVNCTRFDPQISKLRDVYLGPEFTDKDVKACIAKDPDILADLSDNIARESAVLIANKKILGWFQGRMEYGPRSLGNRSILATPVDANINRWLNERLKRTEFMPFAPSCLYESSDQLFDIQKESLKRAAEFMTITFRVNEAWLDKVPAVIHVDNTARPQLVKKAANPAFYELLIEFEKLTGLPLVVNTSFNSHEEPIICNPNEAINALKRGIIDVLVIGNYVVRRK
jgi:carbamoyltransferase